MLMIVTWHKQFCNTIYMSIDLNFLLSSNTNLMTVLDLMKFKKIELLWPFITQSKKKNKNQLYALFFVNKIFNATAE